MRSIRPGDRRGRDRAAWLFIALVVLVGATTSFAVARARMVQYADASAAQADQQGTQVARDYEQILERISTVATSAASFVSASDHVSQAEWVRYVAALGSTQIPNMNGLGIIVPVSWDQRDQYVATLQADTPGAALRTSGTPHELALVVAASRGSQYVGLDVAIDGERRATLDRARDGADLAITEPVHLLTDKDLPAEQRPWTYVIYAPVYRTGAAPASVEDRRRELVGWVTSSVTASTIIDFDTSGMDVAVFAGDELDPANVMATTRPVADVLADDRMITRVARVGGQTWTLAITPRGDALRDSGAAVVFGAGMIVTFAIACLVTQLALQRNRLRVQVDRAVADLEAANERLARQALHDALTRLPNRTLFEDRLDHALERSSRTGEREAVLFLDVDRFKAINDTYGHAAGDQVLRTVASRLVEVLRSSDTAARLGGDEFVALCEQVTDEHEADLLAARVQRAVCGPCIIDGATIEIAVSVGFTVVEPGSRPADVLDAADSAMYRVKRERRDALGVGATGSV